MGLCARVGILLACGMHDYIKRERFDFHKTNLTLSLFIEVPVPSQESEQSCIYVLEGNNFVSFYDISIGFYNYSNEVLCFVFILL